MAEFTSKEYEALAVDALRQYAHSKTRLNLDTVPPEIKGLCYGAASLAELYSMERQAGTKVLIAQHVLAAYVMGRTGARPGKIWQEAIDDNASN